MELSLFEETVVHLANNRLVNYTISLAKSEGEKKAACALKLFLDDAVKSGSLVQFIRERELEGGLKR